MARQCPHVRIIELEQKLSVIFDGHSVLKKCQQRDPQFPPSASAVADVLDAINAIWKEQESANGR